MKIVVNIGHPGHFHTLKNILYNLKSDGHEIFILLNPKEVNYGLIKTSNFSGLNLGTYPSNYFFKFLKLLYFDIISYRHLITFKPDLFLGSGSIINSHVSNIYNKTSINFDTNENQWEQHLLYVPFTDYILTPTCFKKSFGSKQIRYPSYQQLSYLHPKYYEPNSSVLDDLKISKDESFILIRFVSWEATHDIGEKGINNKIRMIKELDKKIKVIVSTEKYLGKEIQKHCVNIKPEKFHDLLFYSDLCITEGATVAAESAILGTHSLYINSIKLGYISDLENRYGILQSLSPYSTYNDLITTINSYFEDDNLFNKGKKIRKKIIDENVDVTEFTLKFINNLINENRI